MCIPLHCWRSKCAHASPAIVDADSSVGCQSMVSKKPSWGKRDVCVHEAARDLPTC